MANVALYVPQRIIKGGYADDSFAFRQYAGAEVVRDALQRAGIPCGYCGLETAPRQDVVLVSLTSACDWWPFLAERRKWAGAPGLTVIGGAGVANVRPFLRWANAFVLGRGENVGPALVAAHLAGKRHEDPAVVWADSFDAGRVYRMAQAVGPYPHEVKSASGEPWRERTIGCQRKCAFCAYTWHRAHGGGRQADSAGDRWASRAELTAWEMAEAGDAELAGHAG